MNYAIKLLETEKKEVWKGFLKLKKELLLYNKHTIYYKICEGKIKVALKNHTVIDNSINILKNENKAR
jgi:hypothetical protein